MGQKIRYQVIIRHFSWKTAENGFPIKYIIFSNIQKMHSAIHDFLEIFKISE